ncbi:MAG TPA: isoprenylcysteine carboxylmethyltransferase family protein [Vicinamibacterales bacterium]|nr:isoprenylcysteine carboxylmethyltransferase family protein [Vicinamibacterales bacterium]
MSAVFKWAGGTMFVASLAYWLTWYLYLLDRPAAGGSGGPLAFDAALFTLFAAHHSILARNPVKRALTFIPPDLMRSVYVWTASVLLIAVCALWRPIAGDVYRAAGAAAVGGAVVQAAGIWLIARSVARLDPLELAGIRSASRAGEPLQTSGPYALVRHPLYLGWIVLVFAAPHMTADRLAFAAISSGYLLIAVPWEERSLRQSFGDAYIRYEARVRWRVIPYVY